MAITTEDYRQEWQYLNRVYVAQIVAVLPQRGVVHVEIADNFGSRRESLELSLPGFSIQGARDASGTFLNAFRSSWIRYMPTVGDFVYVGFGPQNQPRILGGAFMKEGYKAVQDELRKNPRKFPAELKTIHEGEWDLRSSGGAYIYGTREGTLLLSSGANVQLRIAKQTEDIRGESGLWSLGSRGSFLRLGAVKRKLTPTAVNEDDVSTTGALAWAGIDDPAKGVVVSGLTAPVGADPSGSQEFWVHLEGQPGLVPGFLLADEQLGAVRADSRGAPVMSSIIPAAPVRHRRRIYASGSTSTLPVNAYRSEIDNMGNVVVDHGTMSTKVEYNGGPATDLVASFLNILTQASVSTKLESAVNTTVQANADATVQGGFSATLDGGQHALVTSQVLAQVNAMFVQLGGVGAVHPAIKTLDLMPVLATFFGTCATAFGVMAAKDLPNAVEVWTPLAAASSAVVLALPLSLSAKVRVE